MAAKKINLKVKTEKKRVTRNPKFLDEKYTGPEPTWDTELAKTYSETEFTNHLISSLNYYNYFYSTKDLKSTLVEWLKEYSEKTKVLNKDIISKFSKCSDNSIPITACSLIKAHKQGMPLKEDHISYILRVVDKSINFKNVDESSTDEIVEPVKQIVTKPTIQDRLNEMVKEHIFHFVDLEDALFDGDTVDPKSFDYLTNKNVPQVMLGKIVSAFESHRDELVEAKAGTCEQLKEAYKKYKAADYKRFESFYSKLFEGINQYANVKKATKKAKVRKPPAKEKVVSKLKYLKIDNALKLVSVNPVDIIGAKELWVYNVKTRKIGRYIADEHSGGVLSVKGSAIIGYDETKSVSKTLRKPDQQIKEFMNAGKIQIKKYLDSIKATEVKLNGRINLDTVLLKISS